MTALAVEDETPGITFQVLGVPAPQGSKTVFNGRPVEGGSKTGREKHRAWRHAVADAAYTLWEGRPPLDGPLALTVRFVMPRPTTARKADRWQYRKPDLSKLLRCTEDALIDAGIVVDDARFACITVTKTLAYPGQPWTGAQITITPLAHEVQP